MHQERLATELPGTTYRQRSTMLTPLAVSHLCYCQYTSQNNDYVWVWHPNYERRYTKYLSQPDIYAYSLLYDLWRASL